MILVISKYLKIIFKTTGTRCIRTTTARFLISKRVNLLDLMQACWKYIKEVSGSSRAWGKLITGLTGRKKDARSEKAPRAAGPLGQVPMPGGAGRRRATRPGGRA